MRNTFIRYLDIQDNYSEYRSNFDTVHIDFNIFFYEFIIYANIFYDGK